MVFGLLTSTGTLIARFMGPTWGSSGADRTQVGTMLAPWTLLSGTNCCETGLLKSLLGRDRDAVIMYSQYHGCWCPGNTRSRGISNHGIDPVQPEYAVLSIGRVSPLVILSCVIMVLSGVIPDAGKMRPNITWYCIHHCGDWSRIYIRDWIHKKMGELWGVFCEEFALRWQCSEG